MKRNKEKNISSFNKDVKNTGAYLYSNENVYSSVTATRRQTNEINSVIKTHFTKPISVLDIGCGDGTFTFQLFSENNIKNLVAFDFAQKAITAAKKKTPKKYKNKINFKVADIYTIRKKFSSQKFDLAVIRGVLHHLYRPEKAIHELSSFLPYVLVLEPNGYNPILKIIEKISPYHIEHEEKSYFPPSLNNWFRQNGYNVLDQRFVGIVPYFFPETISKILNSLQPFLEKLPWIHKLYTGSNVILYHKKNTSSSAKR